MIEIFFSCSDGSVEPQVDIKLENLAAHFNIEVKDITEEHYHLYANLLWEERKIERKFTDKMPDGSLLEITLPVWTSYRLADSSKKPNDRYFRGAWTDKFNTDTIDIDMEKAPAIHMNYLRVLRQKKFVEMGFPYKLHPQLENLLSQDVKDSLQELRDIPQKYDLSVAKTPDELKLMIPDSLKGLL